LYSNNPKIYELISRKQNLTKEQLDQDFKAQMLFSKNFKNEYVKKFGEQAYLAYKKQVESIHPILKT
jgi:hypothetical protein